MINITLHWIENVGLGKKGLREKVISVHRLPYKTSDSKRIKPANKYTEKFCMLSLLGNTSNMSIPSGGRYSWVSFNFAN